MDDPKAGKIGFFLLGAILAATTALFVLGWLAEEVLESETGQFDAVVRTAIHARASPAVTTLMQGFSWLGSPGVLAAVSLLALTAFLYFHRPRVAVVLAVGATGSAGLDLVLKHAFHRPRPVPFFGASPSSYSFPSGHALGALCVYGVLALILSARTPRWRTRLCIWVVVGLLVGMIGVSRIYLGVHYPSDVIAGYCAAVVWVGAVAFLDKVLSTRRAGDPNGSQAYPH
jgi:membrane-associated phospholipid phosphatase